ncbi:DUF742 domain-containing protein [Mycobacterium sp. MYCO198283]|uniref:DUF742 domain-containing protein n=1 Tax=Mycobacterium sp. MYCO198283 TaxID=2883505 RepID=UPI001E300579|nr:DUF742 domain-containing protein [Mycobacterium sp. MYCO198283]MCG5431736.1 DUF742 domain-containing protein [Mycobacterium sp. MYCO198283]
MDRPDDAAAAPSLVRPYRLTAGRTTSAVELPLEATVEALPSAFAQRWPPGDVRRDIVARCADGPSVAEIAALLNLPLGVARVLVGDLVAAGHLRVHQTLTDHSSVAERRELIGRTLRGLRALR